MRRHRNLFELPIELIRYDDKRNMCDRIAEEVSFRHDDRDKRSECDDLKRDLRLVSEYFLSFIHHTFVMAQSQISRLKY